MDSNLGLDNSIYDLYNKLLTIKNKEDKTLYPFNILSNHDNIIFTKKQIELNYINNFNECSDKKKGGNDSIIYIYNY
jgi:hypothetical protein